MSFTEQLTPLVIPQSRVNVDSNRRSCPSDGFNYPTFRLVNKSTRVYLSEPFSLDNLITYHPFAVANSRGWFAAVRKIGDSQDIILSPLEELRKAIVNASEDDKGFFFPQRDLSLDLGLPTMLAFAHNDTRMIVGVDNGSIYVYDTAALFSSGSDPVSPLRSCDPQAGALRQIAPNPGSEPDLIDTIAVVRSDGSVQLTNTMLETLGGWSPRDSTAGPVAVSWSPKGKHLAIGLRSGDILTFAPNNKSTPNKHIPPAAEGRLVCLNWLSPGHTFRLAYAPQIENEGESIQQIVSLDTKSNSLTVFDTLHPFTMADRHQESHAIILPHWDEDSISENAKTLVVVGDRASVDLEVLGGHGGQWHQQSQENPVSLPLDKQTEETTLMSFDVDLTDSTQHPILYAYLNDGSLQAWHLEHSKPYPKMISPVSGTQAGVSAQNREAQDSMMDEKEAANVLSSISGFNQQPTTSATFGAFSSNTPQQPSVFGSPPPPSSVFGQTSQPSFGQTSAFGSLSSGSPFGQPSTSQSPPSAFGLTSPGNAFANIAAQPSTPNVFGSPSFGATTTSPPSATLAPPSDEMTREASMSDGTSPGFGGLTLGGSNDTPDNKPKPSIFGSFGTTPTSQSSTTSAFGGVIKPAQGFGAFSNFSSGSSTSSSQAAPAVSAFSSPPSTSTTHSAFGQTSFGAKSPFSQPSFGQTGFGKPTTSASPSSGGFAAFATPSPSVSGSTARAVPATDGFSAFASGGTSAFGSIPKQEQEASTSSPFSSSPFGSKPETAKSPFGTGDSKSSPFGTGSTSVFGNANNAFTSSTSNFGLRGSTGESTTPQGSPVKGPPGVVSPPSSPEPTGPGSPLDRKQTTGAPSIPASGFLQQSSAGLGTLGSLKESSPFFKKPEATTPAVTAFGNLGATGASKPPQSTVTTSSGFGSPSQLGVNKSPFASATTASAFGTTSQLGAVKSAFAPTTTSTTPTKPPPTTGFSTFSGGASGFSAFAGQKGSFSDLLKSGGSAKGAEQPLLKGKEKEKVEEEPSTPKKSASVFAQLTPGSTNPLETTVSTTPKTPTPSIAPKEEESTTPKVPPPGEEHEASLSTLSVSSIGSFVDVGAEKSQEGAEEEAEEEEGEEEEGEEGDDTRSFLSSDFSSGPPTDEETSEEENETEGKGKAPAVLKRSPSPTPQPELPSIQVTPSPPAETAKVPVTKEESATPPGSPSKESKTLSKSPSPTPPSAPSTPPTPSSPPPSFGIGLGRPSTRPARSSPLAGAPVSGADEEEEDGQTKANKAPRPSVSPKPLFVNQVKIEDEESVSKRPGTPPLLTSFGGLPSGKTAQIVPVAPKPEPAKVSVPFVPSASPPLNQQNQQAVFSKPTEPPATTKQEPKKSAPTSVFGSLPANPLTPSEVPKTAPVTPSPFSLPPFSLTPRPASAPQSSPVPPNVTSPPPAFKPSVFAQGGPNVYGAPPKPQVPSAGNQAGTGFFGAKPPATTPLPSQTTLQAPPPPQPSIEEGLQKECTFVVKTIEDELKDLSELGTRVAQNRVQLSEALGGSRLKADLGVLEKWKISDATTFGQTLLQFEKDLVELGEMQEAFKQTIREINGTMLKANTRREEIVRFNKAKTDKEFAKMLSTRALGPEHLESQQHLRRSIRAMRDRIQKLESHLQQSKKKLSQATSGKPSIRAPTLDVINRTYRNIDIAIQQQTDEIAKLADRVTNLKLGSTDTSSSPRDSRLPEQRRRSVAVTPHVAVTTAAALNAERSAHKLKKALLKARKEPILNQRAALAPPPPSELQTPQKPLASSSPFSSVTGPLFSTLGGNTQTPIPDLNFNIPEDNFHPGSPLPSSRRGAGSAPKKHGSVPLKKTPGGTSQSPPSAAPPADFWGPLPVFNNPPLNKLAAEVKPMDPFIPFGPGPSTPTPAAKEGSASSLPGGGFEAFMKPTS